ncbi:MAG TPA: acetyl CoA synthetase [Candidatus Korarchaeota archaeon]|nr:acetyl CoA synthetase [Candidatus Korarchaeota archaeon]
MESVRALDALFRPSSIAVIGASRTPGKIGHEILKNLVEYGYQGRVYPVNPKADEILGLRCYHSVSEIPGTVDLGVVSIPAKYVLDAIDELGEKGTRAVAVISSGFSEVGERELEEELVRRAHERGMRVLGPNISGVVYTPARMNATFGPTKVLPGSIAFITQAGALGIALMGWTITERIGLSAVVSVGNKSDIEDSDLLLWLSEDEDTDVILVYMEGVKEGRRFMEVARRVTPKKPVIVLKAGRSARGSMAASSHTGSLAGMDAVYESVFKQTGILRAYSVEQAFDWARAFASKRIPRGTRTVIVTNGGGAGVLATDAAELSGLDLIDPPEDLKGTFRSYMPPFGSPKNPVDLTGQAAEPEFEGAVRAALEHESVDNVIVLYCETAVTDPEGIARAVLRAAEGTDKPIAAMLMGGERSERAADLLNSRGIPAFPTPERTVGAVAAMVEWWKRTRNL